ALRCSAIVRKLLVFARQSKLERSSVNLTSLVSDAMLLVSPRANKEQIEVSLLLEDIPNVIGDEQQLKQVFLNLVLNALEASKPGERICVSTRFLERREGDPAVIRQFLSTGSAGILGYVEVSVSDEGPGISEGDINRVFNPFFTTKPEGTGLGLAISHSIIESHGGQILVCNNPSGKGCTVTVRLPVVASEIE
ncbi:MAG: ATP-binding protein, partial [Bacillota bacterium]